MEPITLTVISLYVADKIIAFHVKDIWYKWLLDFLSITKDYKWRLRETLLNTIDEYNIKYPKPKIEGKIQFYEHKETFEHLLKLVLFRNQDFEVVVSMFQENKQVLTPTQDEINDFYNFFIDKVQKDKKLVKLFVIENYQEEVFKLSEKLDKIQAGIHSIKKDTSQLLQSTEEVKNGIEKILKRFNPNVEVSNYLGFISKEYPPSFGYQSKRQDTVADFISLSKATTLLVLTGNISTGKTQLLSLIFENTKSSKYWISVKDFDSKNFHLKILYSLLISLGIDKSLEIADMLDEIFLHIEDDASIFIDGLPNLTGHENSELFFGSFVEKCFIKKIKIISTSNYPLSSRTIENIPSERYLQKDVPLLSKNEITEILFAFDCEKELVPTLINLLDFVSNGHPAIIIAACRYLKGNNWNSEELVKIFSFDFSKDLVHEIYTKIMNSVGDEFARDLLYRLNNIIGSFTIDEIQRVCEVKPRIIHPYEKLNLLNGLWVQNTSEGFYELSPLIKRFTNEALAPTIKQKINLALGELILTKRKLSEIEAKKAIIYFIFAKSFNNAGFVLMLVLRESINTPKLFSLWGFDTFWYSSSLPEEIDLFMQMYIRVFQIFIAIHNNENLAFLHNDLEKIVDAAIEKGLEVNPAAILLSSLNATINPAKSVQYLTIGLKSNIEFSTNNGFESIIDDYFPEQIIWLSLFRSSTLDEFEHWFSTFENLTPDQMFKALKSDTKDIGCLTIGRKLVLEEAKKEKGLQRWEKILSMFEFIQVKSYSLKLDFLTAHAVRMRIEIFSKYILNIDLAKKTALDSFDNYIFGEQSLFLINDAIGRELFYNGKNNEAYEFVLKAANSDVADFIIEKVDSCLVLSQILENESIEVAHSYTERALAFATNNKFINELSKVKIIGEYSISLYLMGNILEAIDSLADGFQILLNSYENSNEYKSAVLNYGHVLNYLQSLQTRNKPPEKDFFGNLYDKPKRGRIVKGVNEIYMDDLDFPERRYMVTYLFLCAFEEAGEIDKARHWAGNTLEVDSLLEVNIFSPTLYGVVPYLILDFKFYEAIKLFEKTHQLSMNYSNDTVKDDYKVTNTNLLNIIKNRPPSIFKKSDSVLMSYVVIPMILTSINECQGKKDASNLTQLISVIRSWQEYFVEPEGASQLLNLLEIMDVSFKEDRLVTTFQVQEGFEITPSIEFINRLFLSYFVSPLEALNYHLSFIKYIEDLFLKTPIVIYNFILVPFLEKYWFDSIVLNKEYYSEMQFWKEKSLPYYQSAKVNNKIKRLYKVICHHLDYTPSYEISDWFE